MSKAKFAEATRKFLLLIAEVCFCVSMNVPLESISGVSPQPQADTIVDSKRQHLASLGCYVRPSTSDASGGDIVFVALEDLAVETSLRAGELAMDITKDQLWVLRWIQLRSAESPPQLARHTRGR